MHASGDVVVDAADASGVFANVTLVTGATSTNDGGFSIIRGAIKDSRPVDYVSSQAGLRLIKFGDTVRVAAIEEDYSSADGEIEDGVVTGEIVRLEDGYTDARFDTDAGFRILMYGDVVEVLDGYTGGGAPGTYRYIGDNARLDLGAEDYSDADALGSSSRATAAAPTSTSAPTRSMATSRLVDYSDSTLWLALGGDEGEIYEWMGPDTEMDLTGRPTLQRPRVVEAAARQRHPARRPQHQRFRGDRVRRPRRAQRRAGVGGRAHRPRAGRRPTAT